MEDVLNEVVERISGDMSKGVGNSRYDHAVRQPHVDLLEPAELRERLRREVEGDTGGRPCSVLVRSVDAHTSRAAVAAALAPILPITDVGGWLDDGILALLLPGLLPGAAYASAERVAEVLGGGVGLAHCPVDGVRVDTLIAAARSAAEASEGVVLDPSQCVREIDLGGSQALVSDPAMMHLFEVVRMLSPTSLSVLLWGETGVGKELAARALHVWSPRASGPFVAINCASLPDTLIESELYGYERGAFSGAGTAKPGRLETAIGGTLFLDEVGELSAGAQAKLLRALETRRTSRVGAVKEYEFDVRVVAASNRELQAEVRAGRFREDLYFRLSGTTLTVPPLRDRPRELAILSRRFLERACAAAGRAPSQLSAPTMARLQAYRWPGNVRELKNEMEYLAATAHDAVVEPGHLSARLAEAAAAAPPPEAGAEARPHPRFRPIADEVRELEQRRMREALAAADGVQTIAAQLIGMPIRTFTWKYKQYALGDDRAGGRYARRPMSTRKSS